MDDTVVLPSFIPDYSKRVLDVSECSQQQRELIADKYSEYFKYCELAAKQTFSFEDWVEHTADADHKTVDLKWRNAVVEVTDIEP